MRMAQLLACIAIVVLLSADWYCFFYGHEDVFGYAMPILSRPGSIVCGWREPPIWLPRLTATLHFIVARFSWVHLIKPALAD